MTPEERKEYLDMAARRAKPGSGSSPDMLREPTAHYGTPDLAFLIGRVRFVVVGGLATRLYMPERMTLDIDILVTADEAPRAETALQEAGWERFRLARSRAPPLD